MSVLLTAGGALFAGSSVWTCEQARLQIVQPDSSSFSLFKGSTLICKQQIKDN